jgi:hypothetical protein
VAARPEIRSATDSEADAYIAGETPRLSELAVEQAIAVPPTLGSDSTRNPREGTGRWLVSGRDGIPPAAAAAAQGGIRDPQIHA